MPKTRTRTQAYSSTPHVRPTASSSRVAGHGFQRPDPVRSSPPTAAGVVMVITFREAWAPRMFYRQSDRPARHVQGRGPDESGHYERRPVRSAPIHRGLVRNHSRAVQTPHPLAVAVVALGLAHLAGAEHALAGLAPARVRHRRVDVRLEVVLVRRQRVPERRRLLAGELD